MSRLRSIPPVVLVIPLLLLPSVVWMARDHTVWPWDQAWYAQVSVQSWYWMQHSLRHWIETMLTGINAKPPGSVWLGVLFVPLRHVAGSVETALLLSILF